MVEVGPLDMRRPAHLPPMAPPRPGEVRRPQEPAPIAAGAVAGNNIRRGMVNNDHMWEVLQGGRAQSQSPRGRLRAVSAEREVEGPGRGGSAPGRAGAVGAPANQLPAAPPPAPFDANGGPRGGRGGSPSSYARKNVWEEQALALAEKPVFAEGLGLGEWRHDLKAAGHLKHRLIGLEAGVADAQGFVERRLESLQADCRSDISQRFTTFENADKRFKEWVQREHEELNGQLQQVKIAAMDGSQQQQRQATALTNSCQKLEARLQEMEVALTQTDAKANGIAHAVQAAGAAQVSGVAAANGAVQATLDALRVDLEREAAARQMASAEATEKIKELHGFMAAVNERQEQEALGRQQQLAEQSSQRQARFAALEPALDALRSEVDVLREQLRQTGSDTSRRCEEVEAAVLQRVAGVQEAALSAARELWEEHNGVVAECKASMSSLQQILETKDKIAAQLQNLTQQQLQDDKEGILSRLLQGDDVLRSRLSELEVALTNEQAARLEAQQQAGAHAGRIGVALEKAQESWLKDSERISNELRDMRRQADRVIEGEARGWERRLAEAVDSVQRRLDTLESKATAAKVGNSAAVDRVAELTRNQEAGFSDVETRLRRHVDDVQTMQVGKLAQTEFDLRAALRREIAESAERARAELARVEEAAAVERSVLRAVADDAARDTEARFSKLREDFERRLAAADDASLRRSAQASEAYSQLRADLTEYHGEARAYADRVGQDARAVAEAAHHGLSEDVARQATRTDRSIADLLRQLESQEERLFAAVASAEGKASVRLADAMKLVRSETLQEAERLIEQERSARMQAEAERLASLQKRLAAHEELTSRRLEELRARQDDAHATHRQQIEAAIAQDRTEIVGQLEEIARDQRAAAANAQAELARLEASCEKLMADADTALQEITTATENAVKRLEERLDMELAAFHAKLTVGLTTASTELRMGLVNADERLSAAVNDAVEARAALRTDFKNNFKDLETALGAVGTEAAVARADLRTALQEATTDLGQKLEQQAASSEERAKGLDGRTDGLQKTLDDLGTRLEEQGTQLATAVAAVREDAEAGIGEVRQAAQAEHSAMGEKLLQVRDDMRGLEDTVLARLQDAESGLAERLEVWAGEQQEARVSQEQSIAANRRAFENLDARCEAERKTASEALEKMREEATAERQELRHTLDVLDADLAEQGLRLSKLTEELRGEEGRASEAEAALKQSLEEGQTQVSSATEEMQSRFEALLSEQEKVLHAEEARAQQAEADLGAHVEAMMKQSEDRLDNFDKQFEAEKKMSEDGRADLKADFANQLEELKKANEAALSLGLGGELTRATGAEGALKQQLETVEEKLQKLGEQQHKQAEDSASDLQLQLEAIRKERELALEAMRKEREDVLHAEEVRTSAAAAELAAKIEASEKAQADALSASEARTSAAAAELAAYIEGNEKAQEDALRASEARTSAATAELAAKIEASEKTQRDALQTVRQKLEAKHIEQEEAHKKFEEATLKVQEEAAAERATEKATASEDFQRQVDELRGEQEKSRAALEERVHSIEEAQAKASTEQAEKWQSAAEELRSRVDMGEKQGAELQHLHEEQAKELQMTYDRQHDMISDLKDFSRRLQELSESAETRSNELEAKNALELSALQNELQSVSDTQSAFREELQALGEAHGQVLAAQAEAKATEAEVRANEAGKNEDMVSQLRSDFETLKQMTAEFQDSQARTNGSQLKINEAQELSNKEKNADIDELKSRLAALQDANATLDEVRGQLDKVSEEQSRLASEQAERLASEQAEAKVSEASVREQLAKVSEEQDRLASEQKEAKASEASMKGQLAKVSEEQDRLASELAAAKASETSVKEQLSKVSEEQGRLASEHVEARTSEASFKEQLSKVSEEQNRLASEQAEVKAAEASVKEQLSKVTEEQSRLVSEHAEAKAAEASAKEEASAQEAVQQLRTDFDALKQVSDEFQEGQLKTNNSQEKINKDRELTTNGLGEQLGDLVLKVADLMGKVDEMAPAEEVSELRTKVDGGFDALVVQFEADRWIRLQTDSVADGISKDFLNLLDQTCEKLELRMRKCEQALQK